MAGRLDCPLFARCLAQAGVAALLAAALLPATAARPDTRVWVDAQGVTHITGDSSAEGGSGGGDLDIDGLRSLWPGGAIGETLRTGSGLSGGPGDRVARLLRGAASDLRRGEGARAAATLRSVLRLDPGRPEAHLILASLARQRGHYREEEDHLRSFLGRASDRLAKQRSRAERRIAELGQEQRLADPDRPRGPLELVAIESPHFRLEVDSELDASDARYVTTVLAYLEAARLDASLRLGVVPSEALGVVFYGRAAYLREHRHRFSFQTVGFFDGRIHVSSPAHPTASLRSLLYHEYSHALFREQTGGDQPYWLNEGLAELMERRSRQQPLSTRSERASLRTRIVAGVWLPLRRLGPGFGGLADEDARAAYLQSIVAAEWVEERSSAEDLARLLARLGDGWSVDQALFALFGLDTDQLDARVQSAIEAEFPVMGGLSAPPLAQRSPESGGRGVPGAEAETSTGSPRFQAWDSAYPAGTSSTRSTGSSGR